jgi:hypothetical protein
MKVHLVRSIELPIFKFNAIGDYLSEFKGGIEYCFEREEEIEGEQEEYDSDENLIKHTLSDNSPLNPLDFERFFEKCNVYRNNHSVPNDELVILLTNERNENNYFGYCSKDIKNVFIQTSNWKNILGEGFDEVLPIVYEIAVWTLRSMLFKHEGEMKTKIPPKTFGCIMDMCKEKKDFSFKIRTGDIRVEVMELIKKRNIQPLYINQLLSIFEKIRKGVLFRQRVEITQQLTKLRLVQVRNKLKFSLVDFGDVKIPMEPVETIIYCLFLMVEEGIVIKEIDEYQEELESIVRGYYISWEDDKIEEFVEKYTSIENTNLITQNITRINKKLASLIPESIVEQYQILGTRQEPYSVSLNREMVDLKVI